MDIGAHRGESVKFFKTIYPSSYIFSFEPDLENFAKLTEVCKQKSKAERGFALAFNLGMAEKTGHQRFYRQKLTHLGGFLPINKVSKDSLGHAKQAMNEPVSVPTTSIDMFCLKKKIKNVDFLKIDVQGCERKVLQGAKKMLFKCKICILEISFFDFYKRPTSIFEVENLLRPAGFQLWDISKISKNPKNLRTDWAEFVYRRM